MKPNRWARLEELFGAALDKPEAERRSFLDEACGANASLREEVERMLACSSETGGFLESPAMEAAARALAEGNSGISPGSRLGPYEIVSLAGVGGMGEVWKARDLRLKRFVALKVLPRELVADQERKHRLVREARAASALNHANIVTVYEIGQAEGVDFIAMEYVEGKTLDKKIGHRGLKLNEALKIAVQIADALAKAHAAGIVHRDLKPSNVMVTVDGRVKLLDFGLAKLSEVTSDDPALPTSSERPVTRAGMVLGTPQYMSPEQIDGKPADARSDIFAFGCVLYELASGRKAFGGETVGAVLAATALKEPEPLEDTPAELEKLIQRCLRKDPERRLQDMGDARIALEEIREAPEPTGPSKPRASSWRLVFLAGALAGMLVLTPATVAWLRDDRNVDLGNYKLTPFATSLDVQNYPAWSPDGKSIAFIGRTKGSFRIYVQRLDSTRPQPLTELPLAGPLLWTPDSLWICVASTVDGKFGLWKVAVAGGQPVLVQPDGITGSFSPDGRTLVFGRRGSPDLWIASPPEAPPHQYQPSPFQVTGQSLLTRTRFSPDGKKILVRKMNSQQGVEIWLLPWPPGKARRVEFHMPESNGPVEAYSWLPDSRHVLFQAMGKASLVQRLFLGDSDTGRVWLAFTESRRAANPSISPDGTKVVYGSWLSQYRVVEVPLDGGPVREPLNSYQREYMPAFSPTERAMVYVTDRRGELEVWMESLTEHWSRALLTPSDFRVPPGPPFFLMTPLLSPDSRWVVVVGGLRLWIAGVAGGSPPVRVTDEVTTESSPTWSPDGQWIAYGRVREGKSTLAKVKAGTAQQPIHLAENLSNVSLPEWSPTGDWIACTVMNEPGITLVNPDTRETKRLASASAPHAWSRDGKTIYQVRGANNNCSLWAVDTKTGKERVIRDVGDMCPATPLYPGYRITLAPDGKSLAWTVGRGRSEIWILDGLRIPRPRYARLLGLR